MHKIKIATLASTMPTGGAEKVTLSVFSRLDTTRFQTEHYFLKEFGTVGEQLLGAGGAGHERLQHNRVDPGVFFRLLRLLRAFSPDILYMLSCHRNAMFWGGLCASFLPYPCRRVIAVHHTPTVNGDRNFGLLEKCFLPSTSAIVAVSPLHARAISSIERINPKKIVVIENGVDLERFERVDAERLEEYRRRLGISQTDRVVVMVAALRPFKGHETLLAAAQILVSAGFSFKFLIVGDGPRKAELTSLATNMGVQNRVHFIGETQHIPEVLHLSHVSVLPSEKETLPLSVIESMAAGVPVIATDVGSVPDLIEDNINGRLVKKGDREALAEAIRQLLEDRELSQQMAVTAAGSVKERYTLTHMVSRYEALFESIVNMTASTHSQTPRFS